MLSISCKLLYLFVHRFWVFLLFVELFALTVKPGILCCPTFLYDCLCVFFYICLDFCCFFFYYPSITVFPLSFIYFFAIITIYKTNTGSSWRSLISKILHIPRFSRTSGLDRQNPSHPEWGSLLNKKYNEDPLQDPAHIQDLPYNHLASEVEFVSR